MYITLTDSVIAHDVAVTNSTMLCRIVNQWAASYDYR